MEKKKSGISSDLLKWIAVVTMLIDHIGAVIVEQTDLYLCSYGKETDLILRGIGRLAFPIYCFILVEGFYHTRSKKKYFRNLLIFAFVSEIPFEMAILDRVAFGFYNVYWTLLIGFLVMLVIEEVIKWAERKKETGKGWKEDLCVLLIVAAGAAGAEFLHTDYGAIGVFLIYILYRAREDRMRQCILGAVAMAYEITAPVSFYLLYHYNGIRRQKRLKYFFYAFYPMHLLILYFIRECFFR